MEMKVTFPGGKRVYADYHGFTHQTDQPVSNGGEGSAPSPFELFLAAMGTCAGIYVLGFCQQRDIDSTGIELIQRMEFDPVSQLMSEVKIEIRLPATFPAKYAAAAVSAAQLCLVKKHLEHPPKITVTSVLAPA